jgi:hypothetical protein
VVSDQLIPERGVDVKKLEPEIKDIIGHKFEHHVEFCNNLSKGMHV